MMRNLQKKKQKFLCILCLLFSFSCGDPESSYKPTTELTEYVFKNSKNNLKGKKRPLFVFLHGYGKTEKSFTTFLLENALPNDFYGVSLRGSEYFPPSKKSPRANMYRWFPLGDGTIDYFLSGKPLMDDTDAGYLRMRPGIENSISLISKFIDKKLSDKSLNLDPDNVWLCGFSQGGIMAYSTALDKKSSLMGKIKRVIVIGGVLDSRMQMQSYKNKDLKYLIVHSDDDKTVPVRYAEYSGGQLEHRGIITTVKKYSGPHTPNDTENKNMISNIIKSWIGKNLIDNAEK